jgi:hypothetical protein
MILYGESYDLFILLIFTNVYTILENLAKCKQVHREFIKLSISKSLEREQQLDDLFIKKIEAENRKKLDDIFARVNAKINNFK